MPDYRPLPTRRSVLAGIGTTAGAATVGGVSALANTLNPKYPGMMLDVPASQEAQQRLYPDLIGRVYYYHTKYEDTYIKIARKHNLGYTELIAANPGVDPWLPGKNTKITLPTAHLLPAVERKGIVLNLADLRLYYFVPDQDQVLTYAIGIGSEGWATPKGATQIVRKKANPAWYVPESIRKEEPDLPSVVPAGPDNPLGTRAIYLGWPSYLIHGTNKPRGVGRRVSHGCVRLYPEGIEDLFEKVGPGMQVRIVDQPVKLGWVKGELVLEVHPSQDQTDQLEHTGKFAPEPLPELEYRIMRAAGNQADRLDWDAIRRAEKERNGIPMRIFQPPQKAAAR
jgi:L,D-transpeptidase ErfK/SrfK